MTAFEEVKVWCAKHLGADDYKVVPESENYYAAIYFEPLINDNNIPCLVFDEDGAFQHSDICTNDEIVEHIEDYEQKGSLTSEIVAEPPLTSIGGMMVRKMIAEYERKQQ